MTIAPISKEPSPRMRSAPASMPESDQYDVAILGSGLAGTVLAACLARNGVRVLILDAGSHPRFAIGESTIPYTSMIMRLVSERYGVPELKKLTTFEAVQAEVTRSCGIKRNFGFIYHRPGELHNPAESHQFPIPRVTHTENHFFRQDVDAWMLAVAVKYGAQVRQYCKVSDVEIDAGGVTLVTDRGESIAAKFVVDASGFRSPLAAKFGLREEPTRLRHHSRSLFTHMVGVTPFENTYARDVHHPPTRWSQGTLHHLFPGGWAWVIPFDNHSRASNNICSVGLSFDPRMHPTPDCSPEQEWRRWLDTYPDAARQFTEARAVRPWVRTDRLQYSSRETIGYRWCLTSHAAGFVDALFSRGLSNTMEIVNALAWRLLDAIAEDDFAVERFSYVQELEQGLLDFNDDLVANAYTSFGNFKLWDAWFRIWSLGQALVTFEINRSYARYLDSHDTADLQRLERLAPSAAMPDYAPVRTLFKAVSERVQAVQAGDADAEQAADDIMRMLAEADFVPPMFGLEIPGNRWMNGTNRRVLRTLAWAKREAPAEIGELVYEGLTMFIKKRFARDEFNLNEELKHILAAQPVVGVPFRSKKY